MFVFKILIGKTIGNRPLGMLRNRYENNITIDITKKYQNRIKQNYSHQSRNCWRDLVKAKLNLLDVDVIELCSNLLNIINLY